jgi:hypothetical protein
MRTAAEKLKGPAAKRKGIPFATTSGMVKTARPILASDLFSNETYFNLMSIKLIQGYERC